jgi:glycosyltransferase involved in cell wall biosynthesis
MDNLTLVIPAKNEKESLPQVLEELKKFNLKTLVVLEEQDVETINSIKNYKCKIINQSKKGYGNALIEGINNTTTKYFCIFNADGSFNPSELKNMHRLAQYEKFDLVFGSRYEKNAGSDDDTIVTFIGNKIFSFLGKVFFALPLSDILYTFVLGDTEKVKKLRLTKEDFSFCVELPIKAKKADLKLTTNVAFERKRIGGKKKVNAFKDGFKILVSMISLLFI